MFEFDFLSKEIPKGYVDLHVHTNISDGNLTAPEVIELALSKNLKAIAITDHDTVAALPEAMQEGAKRNLIVIPGIELTSVYENREVHILHYFINQKVNGLAEYIEGAAQRRLQRMQIIIDKLNLNFNLDLSFSNLYAKYPNLERVHIVEEIMQKRKDLDVKQAFALMDAESPAYEPFKGFSALEAIKLYKDWVTLPVVAHPGGFDKKTQPLKMEEIKKLKEAGLQGLEVLSTFHSFKEKRYYSKIAKNLDLIVTGGSDCHGDKFTSPWLGKVKTSTRLLNKMIKHYLAFKNTGLDRSSNHKL